MNILQLITILTIHQQLLLYLSIILVLIYYDRGKIWGALGGDWYL